MITKNAKYGETNGVVVAEMGTGDVHMIGSEKAENGSVHFEIVMIVNLKNLIQ